jgi:uncharacterized protein with HEPN domain
MHSEQTDIALRDILHHIDLATRFSADGLKARYPEISWKQMAAAGNVYRHDYEDVAAHLIWDTVERSLPALRAIVEREIERHEE